MSDRNLIEMVMKNTTHRYSMKEKIHDFYFVEELKGGGMKNVRIRRI
jgi:hypothetical protein